MSNKGFSYTRTIIALLVITSILPIVYSCFDYVARFKFNYSEVTDELTLIDLRRVLLLSYDLEIHEHELSFIYHNDNYVLRYVNDKLILQPGTQIYLNDIREVNFFIKNDCLYMHYVTNDEKEYEKVIYKSKGIHITDFPINNDERDDDDFINE